MRLPRSGAIHSMEESSEEAVAMLQAKALTVALGTHVEVEQVSVLLPIRAVPRMDNLRKSR
jgi:hypothetical protein